MEISLLTPKCTLVPSHFFDPSSCADSLAEVAGLESGDKVEYIRIPQYDAVLIYATYEAVGTAISKENISGGEKPLPEMYFILRDLPDCTEYNKVLCSWQDGYLFLAIAQGKTLLLANVYKAPDFTTAEYYIFLSMKSLQPNPEVSTICLRSSVGLDEEMSLYRYFKAVEVL